MMENNTIQATELGPEIRMEVSGMMTIKGRSMMEDASIYYKSCYEWVARYIVEQNKELSVEIDLSYFNSSSAKQLLKILMMLDDSDVSAKIIWVYPSESDVLYERGQEMEIMLDLPFEYKSK